MLATPQPAPDGGSTHAAVVRNVFKTAHYTITITDPCDYFDRKCKRVTYHSVSTTGKTLTLHGSLYLRPCSDGVTPCAIQGYGFQNGTTQYFIHSLVIDPGAEGDLIVSRGNKELLREPGVWVDPPQ